EWPFLLPDKSDKHVNSAEAAAATVTAVSHQSVCTNKPQVGGATMRLSYVSACVYVKLLLLFAVYLLVCANVRSPTAREETKKKLQQLQVNVGMKMSACRIWQLEKLFFNAVISHASCRYALHASQKEMTANDIGF
ncbi:unnamed protein product, partial [Ceratitis capitata]